MNIDEQVEMATFVTNATVNRNTGKSRKARQVIIETVQKKAKVLIRISTLTISLKISLRIPLRVS